MTIRAEPDATFMKSAWQRHLRLALPVTGGRLRAEELLQAI